MTLQKPFPDRPLTLAVLGSSGAVGAEILKILEERSFPIRELRLLASERSAGQVQFFKGEDLVVKKVSPEGFEDVDLVLASAGGSISRKWRKVINSAGAVIVDNSNAYRMEPDVPLVVPEVNPSQVFTHKGLIANPNCTTILLALVLAPLSAQLPIKRVVVSTYQSASGAGARAMNELKQLSQDVLNGNIPKSEILPYSLAFNLFLHNSPLQSNNYCEEEMKMINETRKILNQSELAITATCVRVPVLRAHSESINIEFAEPFPVEEARKILSNASGIKLLEDIQMNRFPMPIDVTGKDDIAVGRIRQDLSNPKALELWLCGDQIRKGAALNAIQIAELLLTRS
ncbi:MULTISPECIES: aspartate-semialdehyde dehydrogenase [Prochlorococcus]|uniref:Aspartate-semialdehyde dehydrogenase n=1 Tax=Prochlorococcus marinus (strain SARG / CCMP1375 / SS120) TaxID=167539 RepID=DHAS_PROMA|nr:MULTISPECIES: aspartate-semialdehyde dehydrogenase [Prochlorococcus]P49420.2 RecName: Full=Aspartate-semialdehyde dehydrogenase; Short=ASA dehydrogenase; Short=ASADH; AltName: Full=Aspartate-beta-semialdehyde dehydrogenase [Prochlorococcus marinus subsp. marinus str. CCMP1375]AAQ00858.1 Aspartate-semialdehyde dehydrogenase [Prochlorococcus marinus subsp. marinus str. CCMP1375]KGG10646.1 Aspartate-semialdehyde dehydrogenase [Prochlorococcus marinus str. LG]KGG19888.1 Aspartate-semialdehyde de